MAVNVVSRMINGLAQQSAVDTDTEVLVLTNVLDSEDVVLKIKYMEFQLPSNFLVVFPNALDWWVEVAVAQDVGGATNLSDKHGVWRFQLVQMGAALSITDRFVDGEFSWTPPIDMFLYNETFSIHIKSAATGQSVAV